MYNSLFWSISPQDAVTHGGFLVDIVDDDIPSSKLPALRAQIVRLTGDMGYLPPQLGYLAWRGLKG